MNELVWTARLLVGWAVMAFGIVVAGAEILAHPVVVMKFIGGVVAVACGVLVTLTAARDDARPAPEDGAGEASASENQGRTR